jgi:hypothetical protein
MKTRDKFNTNYERVIVKNYKESECSKECISSGGKIERIIYLDISSRLRFRETFRSCHSTYKISFFPNYLNISLHKNTLYYQSSFELFLHRIVIFWLSSLNICLECISWYVIHGTNKQVHEWIHSLNASDLLLKINSLIKFIKIIMSIILTKRKGKNYNRKEYIIINAKNGQR